MKITKWSRSDTRVIVLNNKWNTYPWKGGRYSKRHYSNKHKSFVWQCHDYKPSSNLTYKLPLLFCSSAIDVLAFPQEISTTITSKMFRKSMYYRLPVFV